MYKTFLLLSSSFLAIFVLTANIYFSQVDLEKQVNDSWEQHQLSYEKHIIVMGLFNVVEQISRELLKTVKAEDEFELDDISQEISSLRGQYIQLHLKLNEKELDDSEKEFILEIVERTNTGRQSQLQFDEILKSDQSLEEKMTFMIDNVFIHQTKSQIVTQQYISYLEQMTSTTSNTFKTNNNQLGKVINQKLIINLILITILSLFAIWIMMKDKTIILKKNFELQKSTHLLEERVAERTSDLLLAKKQAEEATQTKSDFLANMSHEIRTPMNAIIGLNYLTTTTNLTSEQKEYTDKIDDAAHNLLGIINDILDFSKIEAKQMLIETIPFSLHDLMMGIENIIRAKLKEKNLHWSVNHPTDIPEVLLGDPLRLRQVLINLCNNAIKFTSKGDVSLSINVKDTHNSQIILEFLVQDTGIGMSDEQLENIFNSFIQADTSTTRQYGGTGLGLAICKQLTELMGGKIWVESHLGSGSTFYFSIKLGISDQTALNEQVKRSELKKDDSDAIIGCQILLVEDNKVNQLVAKKILKNAGVIVQIANNGQEAIDKLQQQNFDAVLMDIQMPIMGGIEATEKIRILPAHKNLPIIAMTANAMIGDKEKCLNAGMNDYLSKPINPKSLMSMLSKWVNAA